MASGTLGPGLIEEKIDLIPHQGDDAVAIVQHLNGPQGQGAPQFPQGFMIQAHLEKFDG